MTTRNALSDENKKQWSTLAKQMNKRSFGALNDIVRRFEAYLYKVGPMGPPSRDIILGEDEVLRRRVTPASVIVDNWKGGTWIFGTTASV